MNVSYPPIAVDPVRRLNVSFGVAATIERTAMLGAERPSGQDAILGAEVAQAYKPTPEAYLRTVDV
jgi:hypothetical protein